MEFLSCSLYAVSSFLTHPSLSDMKKTKFFSRIDSIFTHCAKTQFHVQKVNFHTKSQNFVADILVQEIRVNFLITFHFKTLTFWAKNELYHNVCTIFLSFLGMCSHNDPVYRLADQPSLGPKKVTWIHHMRPCVSSLLEWTNFL